MFPSPRSIAARARSETSQQLAQFEVPFAPTAPTAPTNVKRLHSRSWCSDQPKCSSHLHEGFHFELCESTTIFKGLR
jgi:hypothetical protein